jgi:hypothetical protein
MQRLFSAFPTGMAGIGLLILRFSMAAVLVDVAAHPPFTTSFSALLAMAVETGKE